MELGRELHDADGLSITLGLGHPEVPGALCFRIPALLVPDHGDGAVAEQREAADEGRVFTVPAVAVELGPVGEHQMGSSRECKGAAAWRAICARCQGPRWV